MATQPTDEEKTANKNRRLIIAAVAIVAVIICLCSLCLIIVLFGRPVLCSAICECANRTITPLPTPTRLPSGGVIYPPTPGPMPTGLPSLPPLNTPLAPTTRPLSPTPATTFTLVPTPPRQPSPSLVPKGLPTLCPGCVIGGPKPGIK
jgi:hypothetical protein